MNLSVAYTSFKVSLLSSSIFWGLIIIFEEWEFSYIPAWLVSVVLLFIFSIFMIAVTILPIYEHYKTRKTHAQFFNQIFPYYAIVFFSITAWIWDSTNEAGIHYILVSAFISALMSWVWLFKEDGAEMNDPK